MDNEKLINMWKRRCLKANHDPVALICVDKKGFPIVMSIHNSELLNQIFKHLAAAPLLDESTHLENEN